MNTLSAGGCDGLPTKNPGAGALLNPVGNPPRSKVKGRKKEKRLKKGMNAEAKRKNKCSICKSTEHNAARCPEKMGERVSESGCVRALGGLEG